MLFVIASALSEAPLNEDPDIIKLDFSMVLSIFGSLFVCINILNSYIINPLIQISKDKFFDLEKKYAELVVSMETEEGQQEFRKILDEAKSKPGEARIASFVFNFISIVLWFVIVLRFLNGAGISRDFLCLGFLLYLLIICVAIYYLYKNIYEKFRSYKTELDKLLLIGRKVETKVSRRKNKKPVSTESSEI